MLYIQDIIYNKYIVYDTDDRSYNELDKSEVLELNKYYKILGVSNNNIKKVDLLNLVNKWKLLGVLEQKLNNLSINDLFNCDNDYKFERHRLAIPLALADG